VTTFTAGPGIETLPIWIFGNMTRPRQAPVVTPPTPGVRPSAVFPPARRSDPHHPPGHRPPSHV
ncbi:ABC transporter permease, partial [Streptomyces sp. NPDC046881]